MEKRPTSKTVTAYATGVRVALFLQIAVAGIALAALAISAYFIQKNQKTINTQTDVIAANDEKIRTVDAQIAAAEAEAGRAQNTLTYTRRGTQALLEAGELALSPNRRDAAINVLAAAIDELPEIGIGENVDEAALTQVRQSLIEARVDIIAAQKKYGEALAEVRSLIEFEGTDVTSELRAREVGYLCALDQNIEAASVLDTLDEAMREAVSTSAVVVDFCGDQLNVVDMVQMSVKSLPPAITDGPRLEGVSEYRIERVFLHIYDEGQRATATEIANYLCDLGYSVPGIERIDTPTSSNTARVVRYYPEQTGFAEELIADVREASGQVGAQGWAETDFSNLLFSRDGLPTNQLEVWFPREGGVRRERGDPGFSCRARMQRSAPSQDVAQLVEQLAADDAMQRVAAGEQIALMVQEPADRWTYSGDIYPELIAQLEAAAEGRISANGRFNTLYTLNLRSDWADQPGAEALSRALDRLETSKTGVGRQSMDCIAQLRAKLEGREANDRCGGR